MAKAKGEPETDDADGPASVRGLFPRGVRSRRCGVLSPLEWGAKVEAGFAFIGFRC